MVDLAPVRKLAAEYGRADAPLGSYLGIIALDFFAIVNIMTPHPEAIGNSTEVIAHYLFTRAFSGDSNPQYGYASTIGVVLFFLSLTLAAVMFRASRRERVEYS